MTVCAGVKKQIIIRGLHESLTKNCYNSRSSFGNLSKLYHLAEFKKLTTGTFDYFPEMSIVRWGWYLVVHRLYSILHKIVNIGLFATNCVITV